MTLIKIATRGSKLALWQANYVSNQLTELGFTTELNVIKTQGDKVQDRFLHEIGGKGLFVKELEQAMLDGEADIAVHSLKDLPAVVPEPFHLPAILKRHNPADAIILSPKGAEKLSSEQPMISMDQFRQLPPFSIATSSLRRQSLFKSLNSEINLHAVRGNVDTRINKLMESDWDALILAAASLERLGIDDVDFKLLDLEWFVPCAAQGALAIECQMGHPYADEIARLSDPKTLLAATAERKLLERLGGDCTMPCGIHITTHEEQTITRALVLNYQGDESRSYNTYSQSIDQLSREQIVDDAFTGLMNHGLEQILEDLKLPVPDLGSLHY